MEKEIEEFFRRNKKSAVEIKKWWGSWWMIPIYNENKTELLNVELTPPVMYKLAIPFYFPIALLVLLKLKIKQSIINFKRDKNNLKNKVV